MGAVIGGSDHRHTSPALRENRNRSNKAIGGDGSGREVGCGRWGGALVIVVFR